MTLNPEYVMEIQNLTIAYNGKIAVRNVSLKIIKNHVTVFMGKSGCGKSTVLRELNRMNMTLPDVVVTIEGNIMFRGRSIYESGVLPEELRRRVGMVFQKPNPLPKSIFNNVAYGPRLAGINDKDQLMSIVETCLQKADLWKDVRTRLNDSALSLSVGQQQRLCFARTLANEPEVILLDESTASLDPIATGHIERLILKELVAEYTVVMVTHDIDQAYKIADDVAFFGITSDTETVDDDRPRWGELVEDGPKDQIFGNPHDPRTAKYVKKRYGA